MLHRKDWQLQPHQAPYLARPEARGVDNMLGSHRALLGDDIPAAILARLQIENGREAVNFRAQFPRRLGIGIRDPRRIDMAFERIVESTDEVFGLSQRKAPHDLVDRYHLHL